MHDDQRSEERTRPSSFGKTLFGLALPVLPVLAAEPIYLLVDGVVVGRVGSTELAALGVGSLLLTLLGTQMNFLSYGTTARAARFFGAGRTDLAVREGLQASWIAGGVGLAVVTVLLVFVGPITGALTPDPLVAQMARDWLHIAAWGIPLILLTAAGNGWMRGVQRTREPLAFVVGGIAVSAALCFALVLGLGPFPELGLQGSAIANVVGQACAASGMLAALFAQKHRYGLSLRPLPDVIATQLRLGGNLIVRTAAFQVTFFAATKTAGEAGNATLGAHHLGGQVWNLISLVLDSVAIAAQAVVGQALGAEYRERVRRFTRLTVTWSLGLGVVLAIAIAALHGPIVSLLTSDPEVAERFRVAVFAAALLCIPASVVFGLDGVLLGAADAAFLRRLTVVTALGCYLPVLIATHYFGWGLEGIWAGLGAFILGRLVGVALRARSDTWMRLGTPQGGST